MFCVVHNGHKQIVGLVNVKYIACQMWQSCTVQNPRLLYIQLDKVNSDLATLNCPLFWTKSHFLQSFTIGYFKFALFWIILHFLWAALSMSFEVDIPTAKGGGSLLFKRRRCKLPRAVWGMLPRKFWNLDAWKCYFQRFPDSI